MLLMYRGLQSLAPHMPQQESEWQCLLCHYILYTIKNQREVSAVAYCTVVRSLWSVICLNKRVSDSAYHVSLHLI